MPGLCGSRRIGAGVGSQGQSIAEGQMLLAAETLVQGQARQVGRKEWTPESRCCSAPWGLGLRCALPAARPLRPPGIPGRWAPQSW